MNSWRISPAPEFAAAVVMEKSDYFVNVKILLLLLP